MKHRPGTRHARGCQERWRRVLQDLVSFHAAHRHSFHDRQLTGIAHCPDEVHTLALAKAVDKVREAVCDADASCGKEKGVDRRNLGTTRKSQLYGLGMGMKKVPLTSSSSMP